MIKEVKGDILLTDSKVIAHCVAPSDHFDSGLALHLREQYPSMVKDFRHYCHTHHPKPGSIWAWGGVGGVQIINLMAQQPAEAKSGHSHPGKASLSDLDHCLKVLNTWIEDENVSSVAIPKLATGVGGLDWKDVQPLIEKRLSETDAEIRLYATYINGEKAEE